jgi:GH24 family phage-related lysozyme (muramidase)
MTFTLSPAGLTMVRKFEGFRAKPLALPDGRWLVGHGHVRAEEGKSVTRTEARDLLIADLAPIERLVNESVTQEITQAQFDVLVSFAFSIGAEAFAQSQVLRRLNSGEFIAAACTMDAWRKSEADGEEQVSDALVCRRAAEKAMFLKDVAYEASPSALMRAKLDHAAAILGTPIKPAPSEFALAPQRNIGLRITEILSSETATEALLLTGALPSEAPGDDDGEITTAHAKPVARTLDNVREATRLAYAEAVTEDKPDAWNLPWLKRESGNVMGEKFSLGALLAVGLALIWLGATLILEGDGGAIDIAGAAVLITPGLAASMTAAFGFWRASGREPASSAS